LLFCPERIPLDLLHLLVAEEPIVADYPHFEVREELSEFSIVCGKVIGVEEVLGFCEATLTAFQECFLDDKIESEGVSC